MATKHEVLLVCDAHGEDCDGGGLRTRRVALDNRAVEVELCDSAVEALRGLVLTGRPATPQRTATRAGSGREVSGAEIREWARENGYDVGKRGRFSTEVREAYGRARQEGQV